MSHDALARDAIDAAVARAVEDAPVDDIHTHLYAPAFGDLLLWGVDDLLIYHYLVAEGFRYLDVEYDAFFEAPKSAQAETIWKALFLDNAPISEACRGVVTVLNALGLDAGKRDLKALRAWFAEQDPDGFVDRCMELAGVRSICMTNSPFDDAERPVWERGFSGDPRFTSALRIDPLLLEWPQSAARLRGWGYEVCEDFSGKTMEETRRFLRDWGERMKSRFAMVSLPPTFRYPSDDASARLLDGAALPVCRELGVPMALMPGVIRGVNPRLRLAGDGVGLSDLTALRNLCDAHPENRFATTVLARENQHELCVLARKFRNLHVFGCWWFTNVPSVIEEMTRMRVELLGFSFTAQHSDARVMDQIIYKWRHSRRVIAKVLSEKYVDLADAGWPVTEAEIQRGAEALLGGSFRAFSGT